MFNFFFSGSGPIKQKFYMFVEQLHITGHWFVIQIKRLQCGVKKCLGYRVNLFAVNQWVISFVCPVPTAGPDVGVKQKFFEDVGFFIAR